MKIGWVSMARGERPPVTIQMPTVNASAAMTANTTMA